MRPRSAMVWQIDLSVQPPSAKMTAMASASNSVQLELIGDVKDALAARKLDWWLFGGWGLDAHVGHLTRDHGDVEFWVARTDGDAVRDAMYSIGAEPVDTQPVEESREFVRCGVDFSSAFFDRNQDGSFGVKGRWSDWVFPPSSFGEAVGRIGGLVVPTMSIEGMLAMKEQYAALRNGKPLRSKDRSDIEVLRSLIDTSRRSNHP